MAVTDFFILQIKPPTCTQLLYFSPTDFMHTELYLSSLHRRFCLSVWALHLFKFDANHQPDEKNDRNRSKRGAEKQIKGKKRLRDFV